MNHMAMILAEGPLVPGRRPGPIDHLIGRRLTDARLAAGITQGELGDAIGVTFQMIQKYEAAQCRIGVAALVRMAAHLRLPPAAFFDGLEAQGERPPPPITREQRALIDDYRSLTNPEIKEGLRRLIRILAADARAQREKTL